MAQRKRRKQNKNHGNKNRGSNKNKNQSKKPTIKADPYDPRTVLTGDDLKKLVKSEVRLQTRPQVQAGKRAKRALKSILGSQTDQLSKLGQQASGNISSYYKTLAGEGQKSAALSQALGGRLSAGLAQTGASTQQGLAGAAAGADQALGAAEDQSLQGPSSARQQLQQMVMQQKGNALRESQAQQAAGAQQGNTWTNTLLGMNQAAQMQGAATLADTRRQVANSVTDLQNQYAPDIVDAIGTIKDARANKGALRRQILSDVRGEERQYSLSKGALGIDKDELSLSAKTARQENKLAKSGKGGIAGQQALVKDYERLARLKARLSRKGQSLTNEQNKELARLKSKLSQDYLKKSQGGTKSGKLSEYDKTDRQRAVNIARGAGSLGFISGNRQQVIAEMGRRYGVNPVLARWAVKKILKKHKRAGQSFSGAGGQLNFNEAHPLG